MAIETSSSRSVIQPRAFGATLGFLGLVTAIMTAAASAQVLPSNGKTIPEHVYAPYYTSTGATDTTFAASGVKYFTMAFLQTAPAPADSCTVYWNGSTSTPVSTTGAYATGIAKIRANGGDVVPSFGGTVADTYTASGNTGFFWELADRCTDVNAIAAEYERVITTLNVTRIDLDTEEDSLRNPAGIDRRNKTIKLVQDWATAGGRVVEWVYTLPTNIGGLDAGVDGSNYTEGAELLPGSGVIFIAGKLPEALRRRV